jgi:hypothetical protein
MPLGRFGVDRTLATSTCGDRRSNVPPLDAVLTNVGCRRFRRFRKVPEVPEVLGSGFAGSVLRFRAG